MASHPVPRPTRQTSIEALYRRPRVADAASVHALVESCKPLDLNSPYAYLLLCSHFYETCAVGEASGSLLGFISGYLKPDDRSVLFVWQVAVSRQARGQGVGTRLLHELLNRPACSGVSFLETTVTPSNAPSRAMFRSFARARHADCIETALFQREDFGDNGHEHEEEQLLRIGPLNNTRNRGEVNR
jgi:L-2,4-diaminobutyric acid acetyltransferase